MTKQFGGCVINKKFLPTPGINYFCSFKVISVVCKYTFHNDSAIGKVLLRKSPLLGNTWHLSRDFEQYNSCPSDDDLLEKAMTSPKTWETVSY